MEFATAKVTEVGNQLHVSHGDDSQLHVEFEFEAVHQPFESEQQGQAIYKNVPYIRIMFPGDRTKQVYRPAKMKGDESAASDPERFPRQWAAFQNQESQTAEGTPLHQLPSFTKADVRMLKEQGIQTLEQLAALGDQNLSFLGALSYRDKARGFLDSVIDNATLTRVIQERDVLKIESARQAAVISELQAAIQRMEERMNNLSHA
jgi:hypothetical protein